MLRRRPAGAVVATYMIVAAATLVAPSQSAHSQISSYQTSPEDFVRANVQRGLDILNDHSRADAQRRTRCSEFLTSLTDVRRIALFALGPARGSVTGAYVERFVDAFREYTLAAFALRLKSYTGQRFRVTGSTQQSANEYLVTAVLVDPPRTNGQRGEPIEVDFRLAGGGGHYVITDVSFAGVWFAITERDAFTHYLQDNNGNIGGLIVHLNLMTVRTRNASLQT